MQKIIIRERRHGRDRRRYQLSHNRRSRAVRAACIVLKAMGRCPYVVDVHGGAWRNGDRMNNQVIHQQFAAAGVGVFALDFRLSTQAPYPAPVQDTNYGVRWFKKNAASIGANASIIGGLGSSSGGQQMGLVALQPNEPSLCRR